MKVTYLVDELTDCSVEQSDLTLKHFLGTKELLVHWPVLIVDKVLTLEVLEVKLVACCFT